jgi:hypothetical protein
MISFLCFIPLFIFIHLFLILIDLKSIKPYRFDVKEELDKKFGKGKHEEKKAISKRKEKQQG